MFFESIDNKTDDAVTALKGEGNDLAYRKHVILK